MRIFRGALLVLLVACAGQDELPLGEPRWFKGNTHTHTLWSDGDGAPELSADWYKSHGYDFLVLSDHNIQLEGEKWVKIGPGKLTPERVEGLRKRFGVEVREKGAVKEMRLRTLAELRQTFEERGRFLLIPGEEITDKFQSKPIHHGSVNHTELIKPPGGASVREVMERAVAAVDEVSKRTGRPMLVHLNHPNFGWGITPDDLAHVLGERFFEVYNGHRGVRNYGDAQHPGTEKMWDHALSLRLGKLGGPPLLALAVDDAHDYYPTPKRVSEPGRGWVMVRARRLAADDITRAMLAGDFYATSGVLLEEVIADGRSLRVKVATAAGVEYWIRFIGTRREGEAGVPLQESKGVEAVYTFKGDELYVRAVVVSSRPHPNGYEPGDFETAWVQPVVVKKN